MKIIYFHQYFKTPNQSGGLRSFWISKEMLKNKFQVTMITSRANQKKLIEYEEIDGIKVIYIKNAYSNNMGVLRRFYSFLRFMFISTFVGLKEKKPNLIYATSTPLTIGVPALIVKWIKKTPYIFEVRDLWPEAPIQMDAINNLLIKNVALWMEKAIYDNALHIIALSPGMQEGILKRGIDIEKTTVIPNMSKIDIFHKREKNKSIAADFSIDLKKFHVVHFGSMGIANGLEYIIDTAMLFQENNIEDVNFVLMGEGSTKDYLMKLVLLKNIKNVQFIENHSAEIVSEIVNLCDVSIVSFKNLPILWTNSPNKLFDSLSAGIPIIVNSTGWTKDLIIDNNCGFYCNPNKPEEFMEKILLLKDNNDLKIDMGSSARSLAESKYDKNILCQELLLKLKSLNIY